MNQISFRNQTQKNIIEVSLEINFQGQSQQNLRIYQVYKIC